MSNKIEASNFTSQSSATSTTSTTSTTTSTRSTISNTTNKAKLNPKASKFTPKYTPPQSLPPPQSHKPSNTQKYTPPHRQRQSHLPTSPPPPPQSIPKNSKVLIIHQNSLYFINQFTISHPSVLQPTLPHSYNGYIKLHLSPNLPSPSPPSPPCHRTPTRNLLKCKF